MAMEIYRQNLMQEKESVHADGDKLTFERSMDVTPILEGVKNMQDLDHRSPIAGARWLGSIDPITAANWAKTCGYAVGTKGFAKYAKQQLLNGEYTKYAAQHDRRLFNGYDV